MARPTTISDDAILRAARDVFLERGIAGTTAEVARRANISEGSVFGRFKSKDALFRAALHPALVDSGFIDELGSRVGQGDVEEHLVELGSQFIAYFRRLIPVLMATWASPPRRPGRQDVKPGSGPAKNLVVLARYFEGEMRLGRIRRCDPEIAARTFSGALFAYAFIEIATLAREDLPLPEGTFVRGMVRLLCTGLAPEAPVKRPARARASGGAASPRRR